MAVMKALIYKENKVPYYQRLYQRKDGKRLWMKHPRSPYLLAPYMVIMGLGVATTMYGMCRMVVGKKY